MPATEMSTTALKRFVAAAYTCAVCGNGIRNDYPHIRSEVCRFYDSQTTGRVILTRIEPDLQHKL